MRKLYSLIITLFFAQVALAQWPANYGGVMLQGFYWDSFEDTKWQNLTAQADELSKYFDLLWVPNSGNCVSANSMGYLPVYWFDHRSSFGSRERYLTEMITAFNEKGVKVIEDVVINHKNPIGKNGSWIDFANEEKVGGKTGETYTVNWTGADICQNDDGGYTKSQGWEVTGANDEGEDFSGSRDLDHTSANVQQNCITYMKYLLKELGYSGFRLDMVKGYSPYYTKMYNEAVKPEFCVGEYWDGNANTLKWWIDETGKTSAAFDFSLKFKINHVFGGSNWGDLAEHQGLAGDNDYARYSVTFIDNHDTYRDENGERLRNNVLAANAFILALPGTPCIFLKHWKLYPEMIGNMILARKACGITNQSTIQERAKAGSGFAVKTQGSKGTVLCLLGDASYDTNGWKLIAQGSNFKYYVSNNITVEGLVTDEEEETPAKDISIYVQATAAPYLYAWDNNQTPINGAWPGTLLSEKADVKGTSFWKKTFTNVTTINIIFNNGNGGNGNQTEDIKGVTSDSYYTYGGGGTYENVTSQYSEQAEPTPEPIPECAKIKEGHLYVYFKMSGKIKVPSVWVWNDTKNFCVQANKDGNCYWPGDEMSVAGTDTDGKKVYLWDGGEYDATSLPTKIIFSNGGDYQTADLNFENGGFYTVNGLQGNVTTTGIDMIQTTMRPSADNRIFNLQGQQVSTSYRGIVVKKGKKFINK